MPPADHDTSTRIRFLSAKWKGAPRWLYMLGALALTFYLVNAIHFAKLPLRIEESEWPPMAKAIYQTGKPVINVGETHVERVEKGLKAVQYPLIGAWHPPLYLYTAGVSMAILGTNSPYHLRAIGIAGLLLAAVMLLLIARETTSRWQLIGGTAAILLLIAPYAIQGSTFLDIDTSIYSPVILFAIWIAIRQAKHRGGLGPSRILAIGGALALVTWTKMPTAIILVGVLDVWWLLSGRPLRRAIIEVVAFTITGAALFFSTYALWCHLTHIPFSYTFEVTFEQKSNRLFSNWQIVDHAIHWHLRWFGAGLLILVIVYLGDLLRNLASTRGLRALDLPFLFGLGALVTYVFLSPTDGTYQGKYAFPALAALLLPITWMLLRRSDEQRVRPAFWVIAAAIGVAAAFLLGDQLTGLAEYNVHYGSWGHELGAAAISGVALCLAWFLGGKRGFAGGVVVVLAAIFVSQAIHSYRANTSPLYPIPDTSEFIATATDINHSTRKSDIVIGPKDLDFYLNSRVIWGEEAFAIGDAQEARGIQRNPKITAFARDSFGPPVGPKTEEVLNRCFLVRHEFGTASVAYRSGNCD